MLRKWQSFYHGLSALSWVRDLLSTSVSHIYFFYSLWLPCPSPYYHPVKTGLSEPRGIALSPEKLLPKPNQSPHFFVQRKEWHTHPQLVFISTGIKRISGEVDAQPQRLRSTELEEPFTIAAKPDVVPGCVLWLCHSPTMCRNSGSNDGRAKKAVWIHRSGLEQV